jgi:hypothetical protein
VDPAAGEDLGAVEEVEEARHAALVHGPLVHPPLLVLVHAHRHHLPRLLRFLLLGSASALRRSGCLDALFGSRFWERFKAVAGGEPPSPLAAPAPPRVITSPATAAPCRRVGARAGGKARRWWRLGTRGVVDGGR